MATIVTDQMVEDFQRDGAVLVKGLWKDWVDPLRAGIERNMTEPGPYGAENLKPGEGTLAAYQAIRRVIPHLDTDRFLAPDIDAMRELMRSGAILAAVEERVGELA